MQIQTDKEIKGVKHRGFSYKYRAYADDLLFIIENPVDCIQNLFEKIILFGEVAGFTINNVKSKIICKNMTEQRKKTVSELTKWEVVTKVKYLGVNFTSKNLDLFKNNYIPLWTRIEKDMGKWKKIQLSFFGRIAVLKMNVLPWFMFLFQAIPVILNTKILNEWQSKTLRFVCAGKKPRVKLKILNDSTKNGGVQLPNLRLYFEAVCLNWIRDWMLLRNNKLLNIEGFNNLFAWHTYLYYDKF